MKLLLGVIRDQTPERAVLLLVFPLTKRAVTLSV